MNETCDRRGPSVRAAYRAVGAGELYLCQQCTAQLSPALTAHGSATWPAEHDPLIRGAAA
jgi:hypothetical protein